MKDYGNRQRQVRIPHLFTIAQYSGCAIDMNTEGVDSITRPKFSSSAPSSGVSTKGGRNVLLDFFRGWVLITIFISHIPKTVYTQFTHGNFGFTDAADAFVFMAGIAAAYAYGKRFTVGKSFMASIKALHRALVLYCVHITITLIALALVGLFALHFNDDSLLQRYNIATLIYDPVKGFIGIASMGHQLGYFNILPLYSVLLCLLPVMLLIAKKSHGLLLICSLVLWMSTMVLRVNFPTFPNTNGWTFNPLSWQLYFTLGLIIGLRQVMGRSMAINKAIFICASLYLLMALMCVIFELWGWPGKTGLPWYIIGFDKTYLTPLRVLHLLSLVYVLTHIAIKMKWTNVKASNPLALLGKHALPVFAIGSLLSLVGQLIKFQVEPSFVLDTLLVVSGICIQIMLAKWLEWRQQQLMG